MSRLAKHRSQILALLRLAGVSAGVLLLLYSLFQFWLLAHHYEPAFYSASHDRPLLPPAADPIFVCTICTALHGLSTHSTCLHCNETQLPPALAPPLTKSTVRVLLHESLELYLEEAPLLSLLGCRYEWSYCYAVFQPVYAWVLRTEPWSLQLHPLTPLLLLISLVLLAVYLVYAHRRLRRWLLDKDRIEQQIAKDKLDEQNEAVRERCAEIADEQLRQRRLQ